MGRYSSHHGSKRNTAQTHGLITRGRQREAEKAARVQAHNRLELGKVKVARAARAEGKSPREVNALIVAAVPWTPPPVEESEPRFRTRTTDDARPLHYTDPGYTRRLTPKQRRRQDHKGRQMQHSAERDRRREQARTEKAKRREIAERGGMLGGFYDMLARTRPKTRQQQQDEAEQARRTAEAEAAKAKTTTKTKAKRAPRKAPAAGVASRKG